MKKRYFIVNEFFGIRVYDSVDKTELYFDKENADRIKKELKNNYTEIDNSQENRLSAPLKISMNITKECNLRCKQCFSDSGEIKEEELTTDDMYKLFDEMHKNGTFFICIGGGEPFMRKDLLDLLDYSKNKQLAISIVSNGLLITKKLIEELNKKDLDMIWISLDGLEQNHDNLRGNGTFVKAIKAIILLKKYFNSKVAIRISLNKYNITEYKELIKIAESLDVDLIRLTPLLAFGRAKQENLMITQEQYIAFLNGIEQIKSSVKIVHPNIVNTAKFWINKNDFGCHCGKEAIWIDELGNYSPCFFFGESFNIGNIKEKEYIKLWENCVDVTNYKGNDTCSNCNNYNACRGGCRARVLEQDGNWEGIDPLCPLKKNLVMK